MTPIRDSEAAFYHESLVEELTFAPAMKCLPGRKRAARSASAGAVAFIMVAGQSRKSHQYDHDRDGGGRWSVVRQGRSRAAITSSTRKLPPFEQSLGAVLLAAKESVIAPLRPILREYNITEPQWRVMRVINDRSQTDATDLAEVCLLHAPSVTRILKELEERKLIVREPDVNDRRRMVVNLSPEGREFVKDISRSMVGVLREYSHRFGAERLERLADELRALSAAIKGIR